MNTHQKKKKKKKDEITEPTKPVYYGQGKRTYKNKVVLVHVFLRSLPARDRLAGMIRR